MGLNPFGNRKEVVTETENSNIVHESEVAVTPISEEVKDLVETKVVEEVKPIEQPKPISKKNRILNQYGGLESNVPINSPYWKL